MLVLEMKEDLVVYTDPDHEVYALYEKGELSVIGDLRDVVNVLCQKDDVPIEFRDITVDSAFMERWLKTSSPVPLPGTLQDNGSAFLISNGWTIPPAGLYLSGKLVIGSNDETVANYLLQTLGIAPIKEGVLYGRPDPIEPFVTLQELQEYEDRSEFENSQERVIEALAALVYNRESAAWDAAWEIGRLPTDVLMSLRERLIARGLDENRASKAILSAGSLNFDGAILKFFFDSCSGEEARVMRERIVKRPDFDPSLLLPRDVNPDDSAATLIRLVENPKTSAGVKKTILKMENEREHPRVTVVNAAEEALNNSSWIGL